MVVPRTHTTHPKQNVTILKKSNPSTLNSQPATPMSSSVRARLSQWMWTGLWGGACEPKAGPVSRQPHHSDPTDCKACREWHVPCDHAKPQCEHCYQQQILCFYVDSEQKAKRKVRFAATTNTSAVPLIREPTPRRK